MNNQRKILQAVTYVSKKVNKKFENCGKYVAIYMAAAFVIFTAKSRASRKKNKIQIECLYAIQLIGNFHKNHFLMLEYNCDLSVNTDANFNFVIQ